MSNKVYGIELKTTLGLSKIECEYLFTERDQAESFIRMKEYTGDYGSNETKIVSYKNMRIGKKEHQLKITKKIKSVTNLMHDIMRTDLFNHDDIKYLQDGGFIKEAKQLNLGFSIR